MRKRICLISFSPVYRDGRVLRQIEYLIPHYDLTVVGYGAAPQYDVEWIPVDNQTKLDLVKSTLLLAAGRSIPALSEYRYWHHRPFAQAFAHMQARQWDAFYANEWSALPVAVRVAASNRAPVVYDAHEFSPLQFEHHVGWRTLYAPMIRYLLRQYAPHVSASITVCQAIAERYHQEFGLTPIVVRSAPKPVDVPDHAIDPACIQLVHHGNAQYNRRLEFMIEAVAHMDERYHLNFMLVDHEKGCLDRLKRLAQQIAPGRVTFVDPVHPMQIVSTLARYDVGLSLMYPISYNYRMALPNKFFEAINAGLAVVVGQSPMMIDIINQFECGVASPDFEPESVAATVNRLTVEDIQTMRAASRRAAQVLNADAELAKVVNLFRTLLPEGSD